jgi:hypothetical protein
MKLITIPKHIALLLPVAILAVGCGAGNPHKQVIKLKCFITLIIAAVLLAGGSKAFGFLGATPEQCEETYGPKKQEKQLGNETVRIYKPSQREYGGAFVVTTYQNGRATAVRYQIHNRKAFTPDEFALFASLNTPEGTRLNEVGVSIDKRKKIWALADSTAYLLVDANEATMDVVTYEWFINYAQKLGLKLPQSIAFPTPAIPAALSRFCLISLDSSGPSA